MAIHGIPLRFRAPPIERGAGVLQRKRSPHGVAFDGWICPYDIDVNHQSGVFWGDCSGGGHVLSRGCLAAVSGGGENGTGMAQKLTHFRHDTHCPVR
jgi:hypothetical protein